MREKTVLCDCLLSTRLRSTLLAYANVFADPEVIRIKTRALFELFLTFDFPLTGGSCFAYSVQH